MSALLGTATPMALLAGACGLLLLPARHRLPRAARSRAPRVQGLSQVRRALVSTVGLAAAGVLILPQWWWIVIPAAIAAGVVVRRRPTGRSPARRSANRRLVAVQAELLAACLDAGMAVAPALQAVGDVLAVHRAARPSVRSPGEAPTALAAAGSHQDDGPLAVLDAVAAMLSLGADSATAWRLAERDEDLAPLAAAARRSAAGGGALAGAVREHAAGLRRDIAATSVREAGRAGVLMTAPLGVCFLPAFLCWGLAPVVVGLLGHLDIF